MTAPFAAVNGSAIVSGQLLIPLVGLWTADLVLAGSPTLSGACTVTIGNLTLQGTVYRADTYGGQTRARLVAGAGGWRGLITSQGYGGSPKLSTVLTDAATLAGEIVNIPNDTSVGPAWVRPAAEASDILWQLVAQDLIPAWYVDTKGMTQAAAWPATTISTAFTVTDQKPDEGLVIIATEDYASWMPGCSFSAPQLATTQTSAGVHYVWDGEGKFRFEVLTGTVDRFLGSIQQIIARQVAPTRWFGRYAYTISNPSTTTIDGEPVNAKIGLPSIQGIPLTGWSVGTYTPPDGGTAHVMFVDGEPSQPTCVWTEGEPTLASILGGTNPVARLGDQVQSFLPPTLLLTGTSVVMGAFTATATIPVPISGVIVEGSPTVTTR